MVSRPARLRRRHPSETHAGKIELVDEYIDYANRIILGHVVVQVLRQQSALSAYFAHNKALHLAPVVMRYWLNVYRYGFVYMACVFTQAGSIADINYFKNLLDYKLTQRRPGDGEIQPETKFFPRIPTLLADLMVPRYGMVATRVRSIPISAFFTRRRRVPSFGERRARPADLVRRLVQQVNPPSACRRVPRRRFRLGKRKWRRR